MARRPARRLDREYTVAKTRTFIAIEAIDAVQAAALSAIDLLRDASANVKWVEPDNLHWTLQFLGDLTDRDMADVCVRVPRAVAAHHAFELTASGLNAFPSVRKARTIWLGATTGADRLAALHRSIDEALTPLGFRGEGRGFTPHVTLGRVGRTGTAGPQLVAQLAALAEYDGGSMEVAEVVVYASELTRDGPAYTPLARAPLA